MHISRRSGYSSQTAKQILTDAPIKWIGPEFEPKYKWVDGKPTSEVTGYSAWVTQEGLPPFQVKLPKEADIPDYLQIIEFEGLEACEVRSNVYFRADSMKMVK